MMVNDYFYFLKNYINYKVLGGLSLEETIMNRNIPCEESPLKTILFQDIVPEIIRKYDDRKNKIQV